MPKSKTCSPSAAVISIRAAASGAEISELRAFPSAERFLNQQAIVLLADNELASFLIFRAVAADEFELLQIETLPSFRRQGFARKLLQRFLLETRGAVFLEVRESNSAARQLYVQQGFTEIGRRREYYHDPSEDAIVLKVCSC